MERGLIRSGNGYEGCAAFDGFEVIAEPLPTRESRVILYTTPSGREDGCDYSSHSVKLAVLADPIFGGLHKGGRRLFVLLEHGGGRRVVSIGQFYDGGALERMILALPEREQYALLHTLSGVAEDSDRRGRKETSQTWAEAFVHGRVRKSRAKRGSVEVTVERRDGARFFQNTGAAQ